MIGERIPNPGEIIKTPRGRYKAANKRGEWHVFPDWGSASSWSLSEGARHSPPDGYEIVRDGSGYRVRLPDGTIHPVMWASTHKGAVDNAKDHYRKRHSNSDKITENSGDPVAPNPATSDSPSGYDTAMSFQNDAPSDGSPDELLDTLEAIAMGAAESYDALRNLENDPPRISDQVQIAFQAIKTIHDQVVGDQAVDKKGEDDKSEVGAKGNEGSLDKSATQKPSGFKESIDESVANIAEHQRLLKSAGFKYERSASQRLNGGTLKWKVYRHPKGHRAIVIHSDDHPHGTIDPIDRTADIISFDSTESLRSHLQKLTGFKESTQKPSGFKEQAERVLAEMDIPLDFINHYVIDPSVAGVVGYGISKFGDKGLEHIKNAHRHIAKKVIGRASEKKAKEPKALSDRIWKATFSDYEKIRAVRKPANDDSVQEDSSPDQLRRNAERELLKRVLKNKKTRFNVDPLDDYRTSKYDQALGTYLDHHTPDGETIEEAKSKPSSFRDLAAKLAGKYTSGGMGTK